MNIQNKIILISAILLALGIMFSNGFYKFNSNRIGIIQRTNIFTGSIDLCIIGKGCTNFEDQQSKDRYDNY